MNPYWGKNLGGFLSLFFERLYAFCTGSLPLSDLASDEIQIAVLFCIAISATLVGGFLLLQKMAMQANSLSHTILLGIILSSLFFALPGCSICPRSSSLLSSLQGSHFCSQKDFITCSGFRERRASESSSAPSCPRSGLGYRLYSQCSPRS